MVPTSKRISVNAASAPIVVIPARMAAARLPGKPLADIGGAPMIVRVWRQAVKAGIGPVIVAGSHISSTLVLLLERKGHPSINMPKDKAPLADSQIEVIRKWIDQGAKNN